MPSYEKMTSLLTLAAVLKGAKRLCESMGGGIAGTEYILAMILRRSDCCAFEILQQLGVNCNKMYNDCSLSGNEPNIFSDRNYPKLKTLERYGREPYTQKRVRKNLTPA